MFVPNPDKTTWPPAYSKWRPKAAQGEDPTVEETYEGLTPRGDVRTVLAVVQGRGSLSGHQVYHFECEPKTGVIIACVMPIGEWFEKMRRVGDPPLPSRVKGPWYLSHPESDALWIARDREEYESSMANGLVIELSEEEYLAACSLQASQDEDWDDLI